MVETSGERPVDVLPRDVIKIVDVKCPDSGEPNTFQMENLQALDEKDEVKFVISTAEIMNLRGTSRCSTIWRDASIR